jgi:YbbR-like protein
MNARDLIFRNFWLKLFSVICGTIIWFAIHYSIAHDTGLALVKRDIIVPVIIMAQNRDSTLESISNTGAHRAYNITPPDVTLTVYGPPGALEGTEVEKIKVFVDLTDFQAKTPTREYLHADVPPNVYVHEIKPIAVTVAPLNQ